MRSDMKARLEAAARKIMHEQGIKWREALAMADEAIKCGARTRAGTPCRRKGLENGRCCKHGSMVPPRRTPEQLKVLAAQPRDHRGWFVKREEAAE